MAFITKWFWRYRNWTWPPLIVLLALAWWAIRSISTGGAGSFVFFFLLAIVGTIAYRMAKGQLPPVWAMAVAICLPLFMWGLWTIQPKWYLDWRQSRYFLWMIITVIILAWLSNHKNAPVAKVARTGLLTLLVIAVCIGIYKKWSEARAASAPSGPSAKAVPSPCVMVAATEGVLTVKAEKDKWTETYCFPPQMNVEWRVLSGKGRYKMKTQSGAEYTFTPEKSEAVDYVSQASFMAIGDKPEEIRIRLYR